MWENVLGCRGRCWVKVWKSVLGVGVEGDVGGVGKCWGRCEKVCWGVGESVLEVKREVGRGVGGREKVLGEVRESVLGCGEVVGRCEKVCWNKGEVGGDVGECWGRCEGVKSVLRCRGRCEKVLGGVKENVLGCEKRCGRCWGKDRGKCVRV